MNEFTDLLQFLAIVCVPIATAAIAIPVGRALADHLRKPKPDRDLHSAEGILALHARLDRLESSIDAIAVEIERNGEVQRYAARLLELRSTIALPDAPTPSRIGVITPH